MAIAITRLVILTGGPRRASGSLMLRERSPQSVPCGVRSRDFHRRSCVSIPRIRAAHS